MHYRVFKFRVADIARVTGLNERTINSAIRRGRFDPRDLRSLTGWVAARILTNEKP